LVTLWEDNRGTIAAWLKDLSKETQEELQVERNLGQGFFQILCKNDAAAQKVLMRTPHHSRWGTSILQPWCAGFIPRKPDKMRMPVWVSLKDIPEEFRSSGMEIAESIGPVLGKNRSNVHLNDLKFCIALIAGAPFPLKVEVVNPINGKVSHILIDYSNLPICCRHCLSTLHLVKDCAALHGHNEKGGRPGKEPSGTQGSKEKAGQITKRGTVLKQERKEHRRQPFGTK
jgi:hypothetical protein